MAKCSWLADHLRNFRLTLIISGCSFLVGCVSPGTGPSESSESITVRVIGIGSSLLDAEKNAHRNAIQQIFGALTLSERRITNNNLFEDDVSYSKGIIEKSTYLWHYIDKKSKLINAEYIIKVSSTSIQKRLIYSEDSKKIDGKTLGEKIIQGQLQANSEVERHLKARNYFNHFIKNLPDSIVNVENGIINSSRTGYDFSTTLEVSISLDGDAVGNLREAATNYQLTRLPSVPVNYLDLTGILEFWNKGSTVIQLEREFHKIISESFEEMGVCLFLLDKNKSPINVVFEKIGLRVAEGDNSSASVVGRKGITKYVKNINISPQLSFAEILKGSQQGRDIQKWWVIGITELNFSNNIKYVIKFPRMAMSDLNRISEVKSKVTRSIQCKV